MNKEFVELSDFLQTITKKKSDQTYLYIYISYVHIHYWATRSFGLAIKYVFTTVRSRKDKPNGFIPVRALVNEYM